MKTIVTEVKTILKIDTGAMKNTLAEKNIRMIIAIVTEVIVLANEEGPKNEDNITENGSIHESQPIQEKEDVLVKEVAREREIITTTLPTRQTETIETIPPTATNVIPLTAINVIPLLLLILINDTNHPKIIFKGNTQNGKLNQFKRIGPVLQVFLIMTNILFMIITLIIQILKQIE